MSIKRAGSRLIELTEQQRKGKKRMDKQEA